MILHIDSSRSTSVLLLIEVSMKYHFLSAIQIIQQIEH